MMFIRNFLIAILLTFVGSSAHAQAPEDTSLEMTLEELLDIKITSFDGTPKEWKQTPAAIHVISSEDIRNSPALTLPDLLRGVPGIHVGQINSHTWAISSRGLSRRYANKLLVLIDGRSIYTPLFSGVHWEVNDLPLIDIERIEIIRGPGGSLWGANAVNGVINIITKSAHDTDGNYLKLGGGSFKKAFLTYRFGEVIDNNLSYRLTLKADQTNHFKAQDGSPSKDDWQQLRLASRIDWNPADNQRFSINLGTHKIDRENEILIPTFGLVDPVPTAEDLNSYNYYLNANWESAINSKNSLFTQFYYDIYDLDSVQRAEQVSTYDFEIRNVYNYDQVHTFTLGSGYRIVRDSITNSDFLLFAPERTQRDTLRIYAQDEIKLSPNELTLILGTKYERNDHTGTEWQPSAKLIWTPNDVHTIWASVARAVRTPSRTDDDISNRIFYAGPFEYRTYGNRDLESERLMAYEMGYRFTPVESSLSLDLTLFYNDYNRFNDFRDAVPIGKVITDTGEGQTMGAEGFISYRPDDNWNLKASYSFIDTRISKSVFAGGSPSHLGSLMSEYNVTERISLFNNFHYRSSYKTSRAAFSRQIGVDVGIKWDVSESLSLSAWGINLLDPQTLEYSDSQSNPAELPRSFYVQLEWSF